MVVPVFHLESSNTIKFLIENPCDAPWMLYVETLLPALGTATLSLLSFGMDDVVRGAFRPRVKRSGRHRRRGRKGKKIRFSIPELGNAIGSDIMVEKTFPTRQVSQGTRHLWIIDGVLQRVLWYWLIYDVLDEGLYQWSSLIMKSTFCQSKFAQRLYAQGNGGGLLGILSWQALLCPTITYITSGITWTTSTGRIPAGTFLLIATVFAINSGTLDQTVEIRIIQQPPGPDPIAQGDPEFIEPGFGAKLLCAGYLKGPARFTIQWRNDRGGTSGIYAGVFALQVGF